MMTKKMQKWSVNKQNVEGIYTKTQNLNCCVYFSIVNYNIYRVCVKLSTRKKKKSVFCVFYVLKSFDTFYFQIK